MDLSWKDLALDDGQSSDFGYSSPSQREPSNVIEDRTFRCHVVVCLLHALIGERSALAYPVPKPVPTAWELKCTPFDGSPISLRDPLMTAVLVHDLRSAKCSRVVIKSGFLI